MLSRRTQQKLVVIFHGVLERARKRHRLPANPLTGVERPRPAPRLGIDVLELGEVMRLVAAAESEQDAALFATAAFTGLRQGELVALRWQEVDFAAAPSASSVCSRTAS